MLDKVENELTDLKQKYLCRRNACFSKTGNEVINFAYTAGGAPYGFTYNGQSYFYLLNLQGDVIGIYDGNGNVVVEYTYDSWGKLISITGSLASTIGIKNPLRYRGYYYDTETSLYYLQSRYYDPETCRFINADSLLVAGDYLQGTNLFAYCVNNPVMYSDPSGYESTYSPALSIILEIFLSAAFIGSALPVEQGVAFAKSLVDAGLDPSKILDYSISIVEIVNGLIEPIASGGEYVLGAGWEEFDKNIYRISISEEQYLYLLKNNKNMEDISDFINASNNAKRSIDKYAVNIIAGSLLTISGAAYVSLLGVGIPMIVSAISEYKDATQIYIIDAEEIFKNLWIGSGLA